MDQAPRRGRFRVAAAEVRRDGQPAAIRERANAEHWSADLLWRRYSSHVAALAIRWGMSADAVTTLVIATGLAASASLLLGSVWGALLAVLFAHLQMLLDAADGEVARWRRTASARGVFLDHLAHSVTEASLPACLGVGLALANPEDAGRWAAAGLALAVLVLINKSVNDAVAVARASAGLPRLPDSAASREPAPGAVRTLRAAARRVPIHRVYHSVEQAHLYLVGFNVAIWVPSALAWLMVALLIVTPIVIVGHIASALTSPRLAP
jgi:phosphatidylglycerophosphate synthase